MNTQKKSGLDFKDYIQYTVEKYQFNVLIQLMCDA